MTRTPNTVVTRFGLIVLLAFAATRATAGILVRPGRIEISASPLHRTIRIGTSGVQTTVLSVAGKSLIATPFEDVLLEVSRATPNREPARLKMDSSRAMDWLDKTPQDLGRFAEVSWSKPEEVSFRNITAKVLQPSSGVAEATVSAASANFALTVNIHYQVAEGHPAIRKWIEVVNQGGQWLKLDRLVIDNVHLAPALSHGVPLTPAERGAGSSVIAFAVEDRSMGIVTGSEIPSALRGIEPDGAMGYTPEYFEWVLGPGESFISEPVFHFAFKGPVYKTASALSTPLDRALEGRFRRFLAERVGIAPRLNNLPAPQWVSWSNFKEHIDDAIIREQASIAARAGFALISLDQGWQNGLLGSEPDPKKFPDFTATADYVRSLGLRLGVWVSSFRSPGSPDLAALPSAPIVPMRTRQGGYAMSFASPWRDYYARDLVAAAGKYGITYFKQDFTNIRFGDIAERHEGRTQKESVLRGLRGLLAAQDFIRQHAPGVTTEITHEIYWGTPGVPCDLAAIKHADLYHVPPNDYSGVGNSNRRFSPDAPFDPAKMNAELIQGCFHARERFYAHRGLPPSSIEYYAAATMNIGGSLTPQVQDRQIASWLMGAPLVFAGDLTSLTADNVAHYRQLFDLLRRLQRTYGIYAEFQFSGVPAPTDDDWHWWGKLNARGLGAVVVVRGQAGAPSRAINIPWVLRGSRYRLTAALSGRPLGEFNGQQLQDGALQLSLPPFGQEIIEIAQR